MMRPRCAISIDMDPLACYYRIHALGDAPEGHRHTILNRALPRFLEVFERRGIQATFFCVGSDFDERAVGSGLDEPIGLLREAAARGHEIGNHSYSHRYEMARLQQDEVADEIGRAHEVLEAVGQTEVVGFRAPGYDISATMIAELERRGYLYDSSIFPAPAYYAAKAAVMGGLWLLGRPSGAVLTNPRALFARTGPYRPDIQAPWRPGAGGLVELPISVTPLLRVPAIGTSLLLAPPLVRTWVLASMRRQAFFNFELHGIDLVDAEADHIPDEVRARQPDLRVPVATKLARFESMLDSISEHFELVRVRDQAAHVLATTRG